MIGGNLILNRDKGKLYFCYCVVGNIFCGY